uniref:Thiamine biosynthesis protein S n=1 Tax=Cerataulina bicornis TaxID=1527800 RepID=A0A089VK56_CERBC|nr:thiamine biosynthesis protein S [Cerataulina daemon]AIR76037.1 thiamine biosynthesis protein S [Cerataulina daemon]
MITFFLNGQKYVIEKSITLSELLAYFNYNTELLVIEYNRFICPKKLWNSIKITSNNTIEIISIVGGG